ncbi:GNAT family N-acetyltransferase [Flagellimonas sediminis]|uniref:GNAT family N-acetyltransferase n=1 Tax=Flagellimonas sediminis TaxID=2696468 RepID=A0A6I5KRE2_9FLAO|nr:GNAT family N-acetyltransferase [Allomuricauda sediminis]NDV42505.1 GNAT family N-acetyltransferase [Allomuricauda sediminis]
MEFTIRDARPNDMEHVLTLIQQLADFEKESNAVEVTKEDLLKHGFGENPMFHCFVAETQDGISGIALVYPRYSTWKGPVIHLEDLIVSENMRGSGLGTALLDEVVRYGHSLGVKRICWEVLDWNEPAIEFYEKKGAKVLRDWDVVHLDENGIKNYMESLH